MASISDIDPFFPRGSTRSLIRQASYRRPFDLLLTNDTFGGTSGPPPQLQGGSKGSRDREVLRCPPFGIKPSSTHNGMGTEMGTLLLETATAHTVINRHPKLFSPKAGQCDDDSKVRRSRTSFRGIKQSKSCATEFRNK